MKKFNALLVTVLLAAVLLSGCSGLGGQSGVPSDTPSGTPAAEESPKTPEAPAPDAAGKAAVETDSYTYASDYIDTSVELPVVSGLSDTAVLDRINAVFTELGEAAKGSIPKMESESKDLEEQGYGTGTPYMLYVSYGVDYNKNGLLCVTVSTYSYFGGAHGGEARTSYLFDLATGGRLYLGDLMKEGSDYKSLISGYIRDEIDRRVQTEELYELAEFTDIGEAPDFYLTDGALVFYFQEYAYFPYAAGIQEFAVTFEELAGVLNDAYNF